MIRELSLVAVHCKQKYVPTFLHGCHRTRIDFAFMRSNQIRWKPITASIDCRFDANHFGWSFDPKKDTPRSSWWFRGAQAFHLTPHAIPWPLLMIYGVLWGVCLQIIRPIPLCSVETAEWSLRRREAYVSTFGTQDCVTTLLLNRPSF